MSTKAQMLSSNDQETHGMVACRNLRIEAARLQEMRWMVENATEAGDVAILDFDAGLLKLQSALALLEASK